MMRMVRRGAVLALVAIGGVAEARAADLRGSRSSMVRQHEIARTESYAFARSPADVSRLVWDGHLEPVRGNADYALAAVSHPYARPEVRLFIERLAAQYRSATGEQLVVTSLTRPSSRQPGNAHALSVHPAGMALDLRVPRQAAARKWLEETLLGLEANGVLDVTRERRPPHYHVAVFPGAYRNHLAKLDAAAALTAATRAPKVVLAASGGPDIGTAEGVAAAGPALKDVVGGRRAVAGATAPSWQVVMLVLGGLLLSVGRALRRRLRPAERPRILV